MPGKDHKNTRMVGRREVVHNSEVLNLRRRPSVCANSFVLSKGTRDYVKVGCAVGRMVLDSQWRTTMYAKLALCIVGEVDGL